MARKLKTYLTSLGFFDQAVAAPSMKAALAAWGASSNLFHQGFAAETDDPDIVEATMAKPGIVLKRPVGSNKPFSESADVPSQLARGKGQKPAAKQKGASARVDAEAEREAARAFEQEEKRRARQLQREEADRARREERVAKAQAALDKAEQEHLKRTDSIEIERAAVEKRLQAEDERWEKQRKKLEDALRRARS